MRETYRHLGVFSDWVGAPNLFRPDSPMASPGPVTQKAVLEVLGFSLGEELPRCPKVERTWQREGLAAEEVSWSVGYGPRTKAWFFKPVNATGPLPAILALHDHGGFKYYGKEKIADGLSELPPIVRPFRAESYEGRAFANILAQVGFAVLVPDTFMWGSRRFPLETITEEAKERGRTYKDWWFQADWPQEDIVYYNAAASMHECAIEMCCTMLGTTIAGVVSYEDRVAANYLSLRPDVNAERMGCVGLSGGGARAALLQATCHHMRASVIVGMMSTYEGLIDHHLSSHSWLIFPSGWARYGDWPDLAACRAPSPLLVQYDLDDELFSEEGMRAADRRIAEHYRSVGHPSNYCGEFYPGLHKFDSEMQEAAFTWLKQQLGK